MAWNLEYNVRYEIAMARLVYLRSDQALPAPSNITGLGMFWKKNYNTYLGKGTANEFKMHFIAYTAPNEQVNVDISNEV